MNNKMQRGKRGDPNYRQITAMVPRDLALKFKARCAEKDEDMSGVVEEIIMRWLQDLDEDSSRKTDVTATVFLRLLAQGKRPSDTEVVEAARASDVQMKELLMLRDRLFPNSREE